MTEEEHGFDPENVIHLNIRMLMHLFEEGSTQAFFVDEGIPAGSSPLAAFIEDEHLYVVFDQPVRRTAFVTILKPECEQEV